MLWWSLTPHAFSRTHVQLHSERKKLCRRFYFASHSIGWPLSPQWTWDERDTFLVEFSSCWPFISPCWVWFWGIKISIPLQLELEVQTPRFSWKDNDSGSTRLYAISAFSADPHPDPQIRCSLFYWSCFLVQIINNLRGKKGSFFFFFNFLS